MTARIIVLENNSYMTHNTVASLSLGRTLEVSYLSFGTKRDARLLLYAGKLPKCIPIIHDFGAV